MTEPRTSPESTGVAARPIVRASSIRRAFPGVVAVDGVDLSLFPGEIHAIAGENGSGKSTLAKILCGALKPDAGTVEVDGHGVTFDSPRDALAHGIVGISQELTLAPTLSVTENILMGRLPRTRFGAVDWVSARRRARSALAQLGVHADERTRVGDLSIELQQEVEVARAVSRESRVLILDEATSSLSEGATERLLEKLEELRALGVAVVFISHRLREVYACASKVTVLRDGKLVEELPVAETPEETLVGRMVGRPVTDLFGKRAVERGGVRLQVSGLTAATGKVRDATFDVAAGEILGVAGLVGSGKAELAMALGGAIRSTGEVRIDGRPLHLGSPRRAIAAGVAFVPDDRKRDALLPHRSVQENLSIAWHDLLARGGVLEHHRERRVASAALTRFAVRAPSPDTPITQLSGGNQQKVVLARWFARRVKVVVLNEPTRGIDVGAKSEVYRFIQEMTEAGAAVVLVSSELPELLGVADRILVMFHAHVAGEFDVSSATEEDVAHLALTGERGQRAA